MSASRSALRNRVEFLGFRLLTLPGRVVPEGALLAFARGLGRLASHLLRAKRRMVLERVRETLGHPPGSPPARRIVRGAFELLALNLVEPALVERRLARGQPFGEIVTVEGGEHLRAALAEGRGVLVCGAHYGAWELALMTMKLALGAPMWGVARHVENPLIQAEVERLRRPWTLGLIQTDGGGRGIARALRAGEPVGLLLDQNAGRSGLIIDFLGLPTSAHRVPGTMARRFGSPAVTGVLHREPGRLRFRLVLDPPIHADPALPPEEQEADVVRRISACFEARVRAAPEQWLWLHDRWRHARFVLRREARRRAAGDGGVPVPAAQGKKTG